MKEEVTWEEFVKEEEEVYAFTIKGRKIRGKNEKDESTAEEIMQEVGEETDEETVDEMEVEVNDETDETIEIRVESDDEMEVESDNEEDADDELDEYTDDETEEEITGLNMPLLAAPVSTVDVKINPVENDAAPSVEVLEHLKKEAEEKHPVELIVDRDILEWMDGIVEATTDEEMVEAGNEASNIGG
ncbi:hypothetical protein F5B21DRAFT_503749 [Xylaria acuta]|nr:hypothetical protein F5B21DRAFT_503749 [Xylaria acuta]